MAGESSQRRRYALIGSPIDRSPSPAMHNAAFIELGINARYELRTTTEGQVPKVFSEMRAGAYCGFNVTTPLKRAVLPYVSIDRRAKQAGAVNTVYWNGDELRGTITDIEGVADPIKELGVAGAGAGLILGAGGASRAAAIALSSLGLTVYVAARRPKQAQQLLDEVAVQKPGSAMALDDDISLNAIMPRCEVIVQATPLGRDGQTAPPVPWNQAQPGVVAFEMVYLPRQTPFLQMASARGARIVEGWQMLLAQGMRSFEIWTGKKPPIQAMRHGIIRHMAMQHTAPV